jgi:hypothetical protein
LIATIKATIRDTRAALDRLDGLLAAGGAEELPGLALARLAIDLDRAAGKLAKHADKLSAGPAEGPGLFDNPGNGQAARPRQRRA